MKKTIIGLFISLLVINTTFGACETEEQNYRNVGYEMDALSSEIANLRETVRKQYPGASGNEINSLADRIYENDYLPKIAELESKANQLNYELDVCLENENRRIQEVENQARNEYNQYVEDYTNNYNKGVSLFNEGVTAFNKGDYITAISKYESCLNYIPNDSATINNLVQSYIQQGRVDSQKENYNEAIYYFESALGFNSKNVLALMGLGIAYVNLEDYNTAKKYYEEAYLYATDSEHIKTLKDALSTVNSIISRKEGERERQEQDRLQRIAELEAQEQQANEQEIKQNTEIAFTLVREKLNKMSESERKAIYEGLKTQLTNLKSKYTGDKLIMINQLIILIDKELGNN